MHKTLSISFTAIAGSPPFVEDEVLELAKHLPVERILFGSDWPHAEGIGQPRDFLRNLSGFSHRDQQRIMMDNARELTFA